MEELELQPFYVIVKGVPRGPFTLHELKQMKLKGTDFVRSGEQGEFKEISELKELSASLGLQHKLALPQYFAPLDTRLLACAIDYFIAAILFLTVVLAILMKVEGQSAQLSIIIAALPLLFVFKFVVCVGFECGISAASPGKMFLHLRVVDQQGRSLGFWHTLARNLLKLLGVLTCGIGFLIGFFNRRQQCLHDMAAKTFVVRDRLF